MTVDVVWAATAVVIAAVVGLGVGYLLRKVTAKPAATPAPLPQPVKPANPVGPAYDSHLASALIGVHDLTTEDSIRMYVTQELSRAGITPVDPPAGTPFDPNRHRAVASKPLAGSGAEFDTIADTVRSGWVSGTRVIRTPEVTVWGVAR